jgi:hypothetical protein
MAEQKLQIHLRRRFVEQAQARRPRLPGNLKQLGAVGPVLRPLPATSRQAVVKVGITKSSTTGKHLSYLTHAKGPDKQDATLFGPGAPAKPQFVQAAQQDRHQFRLVVSVPEHRVLDRTLYIELFMAQVERDLGRPLDWTAAHHYDTPYPHTHIVLRGRDRNGKELYMECDYLHYGLRARASQLLTWILGPVRQQQQVFQSDRQAFDGVPRGLDDPDTRGRMQQAITATGPDDDRPPWGQWPDMRSQADALTAARTAPPPRAVASLVPPVSRPHGAAALEGPSLATQLAALQQALQAQQHVRQRDQGMGW